MLQRMLRERFGMAYHREPKELTVYALVNTASKLQAVDPVAARQKPLDTTSGPRMGSRAQGPGRYAANAVSMREFAGDLSRLMDAPVVDQTALPDVYEVNLRWESERDPATGSARRNNPELLRLIQRQLGLKLEKRKLPIEVLVIDRVSKTPTEN
jgi:uncharacterized protein (TIGR03435 family)